jgi:hypothetical protein
MTHCFNLRMLRTAAIAAAAIVGSLALGGKSAKAQDYCGPYSRPDLFYNYYVPPVNCGGYGGVGAQLYPCPRPTPPLVGETYITYQPLMPAEFLYRHRRCYYRDNGPYAGVTKASVWWW